MAKLRAKKQLLYQSRMLQVGDVFEPMRGDVSWFLARGRAEVAEDGAPRRGRPPKAAAAEPEPEVVAEPEAEQADQPADMTNAELRSLAEERGLELPSGYVTNDRLIGMLNEDGDA